ncbi:FAD-dependent oxidoreductase [Chloroflexota bacterium]
MNNVSKMQFEKLFEPGWLGQMKLRNRIVMAPMGTRFSSRDGSVSQRTKDWYEARARGGAGMVIIEVTCVEGKLGRHADRILRIDDDEFIPKLSELAQVIQKHGAKAIIQLYHAGRLGTPTQPDLQPVSSSPIADTEEGGRLPRELTIGEIEHLVNCFAQAAERVKKAGFDGVELHAATNYLIAQFLSAYYNKRSDKYGGNLQNRARFLIEIISAIKEKVGQDFPLWCRINGREFGMEGGITSDEGQQIARLAQEAGCHAIHVSSYGTGALSLHPMAHPVGSLSRLAEGVKKAVSIPVIAVGRITPEFGEELLQHGKTDFIAIGKALIADPDLPNKAASRRLEDIVPCLSCYSCWPQVRAFISPDLPLYCAVNAAVGREREFTIHPAERAKKVLIIGGGPAGLETARVAALRGHHVVLFEKERELGGQLQLAAIPPYKQSIHSLTKYLGYQAEKLGVKVELGKEADMGQVEKLNPDVVVLATGVIPVVPEIRGIERPNVFYAADVLAGKVHVGETVVVIGGELVGCETAEFLVEMGKKVTITRRGLEIAAKIAPLIRSRLLNRLTTKEVTMLTGVKYEEITDKGLLITTKEGEKRLINADTIVIAAGARPNTELFKSLEDKGYETHLAGDCIEPRGILDSIHDGSTVGRTI